MSTIIHNHQTSNLRLAHIKNHALPRKSTVLRPFKKNMVPTKKHTLRFVRRANPSPSEHDSNEPSKASDEPYASMKNQNLRELFEMVGDPSPKYGFHPLTILLMQSMIKKQASAALASLMAFLANHLEIVIKLTAEGRPEVTFGWKFEWKGIDIPLGPLCSLGTSHLYSGKILIRNGKALTEPLQHLEPLKKMINGIASPVLGTRKAALFNVLVALLFMAVTFILWRPVA